MRNLLLALLLLIPAQAKASDLTIGDMLKNIPSTKHGIAYDIKSYRISYTTTVDVLKYKDFGLSAGYSADDKAIIALDYDIGGLKKIGFDTPITNLIDLRIGVYGGWGRLTGSNEWSCGPQVTVVNVKF